MKCMRIGCDADATVQVRIVVPDVLSDATASEGLLRVCLCRPHFRLAKAPEFLDDAPEVRRLLITVARTGTEPDLTEAYLEPVIIGSVEWKAWQALDVTAH